MSSFEILESHIKWKTLPFYLIGAAFLSQVIMFLDGALFIAYVFSPYICIHTWAYNSKIKWSNNKRHFLLYASTVLAFLLLAVLFVLEVILFELNGTHSIDNTLLNTAVEFVAVQNRN
jgi:hypothetical protein